MAMAFPVWAVVVALAVLTTGLWAVIETRLYPSMLASAALWSYLSLRGTSVTVNMNGAATGAYPYLRYVFLFFAVACLLAVMLHYLGEFPPENAERDPAME